MKGLRTLRILIRYSESARVDVARHEDVTPCDLFVEVLRIRTTMEVEWRPVRATAMNELQQGGRVRERSAST